MNTIELKVEQYTNDDGQLVYEAYFMNDKCHNPHGPAIRRWNDEGQLIREGYYLNDKCHNPHGIAYRAWDKEGQLLREEYWLDGKELTKEEWSLQLNSCSGKIVTIDGKQYRLEEI